MARKILRFQEIQTVYLYQKLNQQHLMNWYTLESILIKMNFEQNMKFKEIVIEPKFDMNMIMDHG